MILRLACILAATGLLVFAPSARAQEAAEGSPPPDPADFTWAPPTQSPHVPAGYEANARPPAPPPETPEPTASEVPPEEAMDRARKQALRERVRPTVLAGAASTGTLVDIDRDGNDDLNSAGVGMVGVGLRYHFARFGSFQARLLLLAGGYYGDRDYGIDAHGVELGALAQATIRFVGYPFYLGIGANLGVVGQQDLDTFVAAGAVGEMGFVFGADEQVDVGIQVIVATRYAGLGALFGWSFGAR